MNLRKYVFIFFVLFIFPMSAFAEGNLHIGRIQIHPGLRYEATHNSNIFKENKGERSDIVHTFRPSINALYQGEGDNFFNVSYNLGVFHYSEYTDNDFIEHAAMLSGLYRTPTGFYGRLDNSFAHTADPIGSSNSYRQNDPKVRRWYNTGLLGFGYERNRLRLEATYGNHYERYLESVDYWQNRNDHQFGLSAYYRIMPRTSFLTQYRLADINYTNQNNGDNSKGITSDTSQDALFHQFFIGLNFDPTGKVNGDLKLGMGHKDYANDEDWNGEEYDNVTTWLAETNLDWAMSAKTRFNVKFLRSLSDSTEPYATRFTTTTFGLGIRHTLFDQVTGYAQTSYAIEDFDNTSSTLDARLDETIAAAAGIEYAFKNWIEDWLTIGLGYSFENCMSNFEDEEYTEHRTTLSVLAAF
ncbi:MAG: hypothetical protein EOM37_10625 [Proteobacteria bacterium]|nr:hypothetical protein [Pseudomonadota bacterium]NCD34885.1 hypothetical protein [Spartobacteria bacterium]